MESKYKYQFTKKAKVDLDDIINYIAIELSNSKAASDFLDKLQRILEETVSFPESGSLVHNEFLPNLGIRKKPIDNYIMYYLHNFTEKSILVLRIIYGRRNIEEMIRKLVW